MTGMEHPPPLLTLFRTREWPSENVQPVHRWTIRFLPQEYATISAVSRAAHRTPRR